MKIFSQKRILFLFLLFLFLSNCQKEQKNLKSIDSFTKSIIGQWERINPGVPKYEYLIFKEDNIFILKGRGEMSTIFSKGVYRVDSPFVILKSDKIDSCFNAIEFRNTIEIVNINDSSEETVKVLTTIKGCKPKDISKHYMIFSNDSFYLKRDTLFYVLHDNKPIELFSFIKAKRIN